MGSEIITQARGKEGLAAPRVLAHKVNNYRRLKRKDGDGTRN
jgi:hypothetical protein